MSLDDEKEKICNELIVIIDKINSLLKSAGENPADYKGLVKVKNIAQNFDPGGIKNIASYLNNDFRVIYDNRVSNKDIEKYMDRAYFLAKKL